jgi:hypothetical protein
MQKDSAARNHDGSTLDEVFTNDCCELMCLAVERFNGGGEHVRLTDVFPRDIIAVPVRQVADELALRSAVSFTEWMQSAQFAEVMGCAIAESGRVEPGEVLFLR